MKVMYIRENINIQAVPYGISLEKDKWYVASDLDVKQFEIILGDKIGSVYDFSRDYRPYTGQDLSGKILLVFRTGGIGDLLFATPGIKWIKENMPNSRIIMCAGVAHIDCLKENPYIDELYSMPFALDIVKKADYHLMFQDIIESNPKALTHNAYDLFLDAFGIDYNSLSIEKKQPVIELLETELAWGQRIMNKLYANDDIRIGIQLETSTAIRTFPPDKMMAVIKVLLDSGLRVFLFGGYRQEYIIEAIKARLASNVNDLSLICTLDYSKSLRQSIILAKFMDIFISPDSAFIHVAGAFDIPQVGLYGPFPSRLRMLYYSNAIGLNASTSCTPCFMHGHYPCSKGDPSPCFSVVRSDDVLEAVDFLMDNVLGEDPLNIASKKWRHVEAPKAVKHLGKYVEGYGIDIGCGYYKHPQMERLDQSPFCMPDYTYNIEERKADKFYDFVFSSFCLNECVDKKKAILNMLSMLKPNKHLLFYVPHKDHFPGNGMSPHDFRNLVADMPWASIVALSNHANHDFADFDRLDKNIDEYAFSAVMRKNV